MWPSGWVMQIESGCRRPGPPCRALHASISRCNTCPSNRSRSCEAIRVRTSASKDSWGAGTAKRSLKETPEIIQNMIHFHLNTMLYQIKSFQWHFALHYKLAFWVVSNSEIFCSVMYLGMCVEEFNRAMGQRLYPDVCTLVLLNVIAHGPVSLSLSEACTPAPPVSSRLLAYRSDRWHNTFTTDWLQTRGYKTKGCVSYMNNVVYRHVKSLYYRWLHLFDL